MNAVPAEAQQVLAAMRQWLERAVIGLNLCPFAKAVHTRGLLRWIVSDATTPDALRDDLRDALQALQAAAPDEVETAVLVHPHVLRDFLDYNDFLDEADAIVDALGLRGEIQIASFHPHYQFAGAAPDAVENCSNRSPYPALHLLRESSIDRAVAAGADAQEICERNLRTLQALGHAGWKALWT